MRDKLGLHGDEWYTPYDYIEEEFGGFDYRGKIVCCPCDDHRISNFVKFFKNNFQKLGLKRLVATGYHAQKYSFDGQEEEVSDLQGDGDFRSDEVKRIIDSSDIIVTNPPFSLKKQFFEVVKNKGFAYVTSILSLTANHIADSIVSNKACAFRRKAVSFQTSGGKALKYSVIIFTNSEKKATKRTFRKNTKDIKPQFEDKTGYLIIDSVKDIPKDYNDWMLVPVTILEEIDRQQFEVRNLVNPYCKGQPKFKRIAVRFRRENHS